MTIRQGTTERLGLNSRVNKDKTQVNNQANTQGDDREQLDFGGSMEVAALSRPFCLGMLYDCRRDLLVPALLRLTGFEYPAPSHSHPHPSFTRYKRPDFKPSITSVEIWLLEKEIQSCNHIVLNQGQQQCANASRGSGELTPGGASLPGELTPPGGDGPAPPEPNSSTIAGGGMVNLGNHASSSSLHCFKIKIDKYIKSSEGSDELEDLTFL
ncbi:unnamed protein product [Pleuronectes platessa]|uniref:Uncharacterized protein n=1 Tax=Pleuronectes platessa TaxID=8262 RepID=A0A9N7TW85_PLEPL|nr:unnamed protein product [Pleuronectes platessa]